MSRRFYAPPDSERCEATRLPLTDGTTARCMNRKQPGGQFCYIHSGGDRPSDAQFVSAAHRLWNKDGEVEVDADNGPRVSVSEDGAYVQAWVWVPDDEARNV